MVQRMGRSHRDDCAALLPAGRDLRGVGTRLEKFTPGERLPWHGHAQKSDKAPPLLIMACYSSDRSWPGRAETVWTTGNNRPILRVGEDIAALTPHRPERARFAHS